MIVQGAAQNPDRLLEDENRDVDHAQEHRRRPLRTEGRAPHISTITKHRGKLVRPTPLFNGLFGTAALNGDVGFGTIGSTAGLVRVMRKRATRTPSISSTRNW